MPRTDRGPRVFSGNLHKLLALWSLWFVLIMALTSIWYFGERILYRFDIDFEDHSTALNLHELPSVGPLPPARRSLDELVARAQEALPGLDVKRIVLPSANEAVYIEGQASAWFVRDRTNSVAINPYTGAVLSVRRAEDMPIIERWVHTADLLHFGDFGGCGSSLYGSCSGSLCAAWPPVASWCTPNEPPRRCQRCANKL